MNFEGAVEKRNEPRYDCPKTIEYITGSNDSSGQHIGVVINISRTGICLYVYETHNEGQTITIKSSLPVEPRTATVRWVKKVSDGLYKSGLQFVQQ